ncbi:MAG: hypothetical protein PHD51_02380 [Patescibacteria group bacterium]|nr:hypothetical protein [Patescibacteria group bacterium]MDD5490292.1 hypothetical protein [Patescibacteria group bacterium]
MTKLKRKEKAKGAAAATSAKENRLFDIIVKATMSGEWGEEANEAFDYFKKQNPLTAASMLHGFKDTKSIEKRRRAYGLAKMSKKFTPEQLKAFSYLE